MKSSISKAAEAGVSSGPCRKTSCLDRFSVQNSSMHVSIIVWSRSVEMPETGR